MNESPRRSNNALWIGGTVLLLLLFGCMLTSAAGVWVYSQMTPQQMVRETVRVPAAQIAVTPPPLAQTAPPARIIVATPEAGVDYESAVLANIYREVNPIVVNVAVLGRPTTRQQTDSLFQVSSGSGFVWDAAGYIVTNNHVVEGADEVQVTFSDGASAVASIVGVDPFSDIAVLLIDPEGFELRPIARGRLEDVFVGMRVAAIGNPFGLEGTLTSGIVSAIGRSIPALEAFSIPDSIQTDAAINPGNSGGPLLNEQGELIGINAQIRSEVRSNSGVGFAIPVTIVERVVPGLIANGIYEHSYMGVSGGTLSPICNEELGLPSEMRGAIVNQVLPGTPASRAGLRGGTQPSNTRYPTICPTQQGGDIIVAIEDQPVTKFDDVLGYLARYTSPGDTVTLTIFRNGETLGVPLTLAPRPNGS
jgi:S1-C subfamily serine protease